MNNATAGDGFSLLEVIISTLIFSITMLALMKCQFSALDRVRQNLWRQSAVTQLQDALTLNDRDPILVKQWQQTNRLLLPAGRGVITRDKARVMWMTKHHGQTQLQITLPTPKRV